MKKKILVVALTILTLAITILPSVALAQFTDGANLGVLGEGEGGDLKDTIARIMQWVLSFLGIVAVLIILYGGFVWMTAGGDEGKVGKAKQILISGIIGLIIILAAWMIASFVFTEANNLVNGT